MNTRPEPTDPTVLLDSLDADAIRERLTAIARERDALLVLLRAALRRDRKMASDGKAVQHAR